MEMDRRVVFIHTCITIIKCILCHILVHKYLRELIFLVFSFLYYIRRRNSFCWFLVVT